MHTENKTHSSRDLELAAATKSTVDVIEMLRSNSYADANLLTDTNSYANSSSLSDASSHANSNSHENTTIAFAIAVSRGKTQMARALGTPQNNMVKSIGCNIVGDYGDFIVCGGSIALSGFVGHPRFPDDFFEVKVDGSNCNTIIELANGGFFGTNVLTSIVSSCLYQVARYGKELRANEEYYLAQKTSKYSTEDLELWRKQEELYLNTADKLCQKFADTLDAARIMTGKVDVFAYNRVTKFLCKHFPEKISKSWALSRWRFEEKTLTQRELENLKTVFAYLDPVDIPRKESLMRCLAINGLTRELQIMQDWPDMFDNNKIETCISLASQNNHPDTAAFLLDCKMNLNKDDSMESLFL